jgi:nitric oxide reductase NorQ protein
MPNSTALVIDLLQPMLPLARQIVLAKDPGGEPKFMVLSRQLTTSATAKHWKRWPSGAESLTTDPDGWIVSYTQQHKDRGYSIGTIFGVELTESEWEELSARDVTPRSLMIRIDRAREGVGAEMFKAQPSFADILAFPPENMVATVSQVVNNWSTGASEPPIAPNGKARTRTTRPVVVKTTQDADSPVTTPVTTEPVAVGTHITMADGSIYVARRLDGELSDVSMLRQARANNAYALTYSLPGTGKTRSFMAAFGDELITMIGTADSEVSDFVGTYVPTGRPGEYQWVDGPLAVAMDEGRPLLIDEAFLIDTRTMSILYSAMDGRREIVVTSNPKRGVITAREGFWVGFASNPDVPGARVSEALLSRCAIQVEYTTDFDIMETLGVPRTFTGAARNLDTKRQSQEISTSPQARECLTFRDNLELFGESFALRNVVSSAPVQDRDVIADVLSRAYGQEVKGLTTL